MTSTGRAVVGGPFCNASTFTLCPNKSPGAQPAAVAAAWTAAQAWARLEGRDYVIPEDLFALAEDVILHRIRATYEALAEGRDTSVILQEMLGELGAA